MTETPTLPTVRDRVFKVVTEHFTSTTGRSAPAITDATELMGAELKFDSLDHVEAVMDLEQEFLLEIPDAEATSSTTVGDLVALVEKRLATEERAR